MSRRATMLGIAAAAVLFAAGGAALVLRRQPAATVPEIPQAQGRGPRVYREKLEGSLYTNQDLGLRIAAPADWTPSLGQRSDERPAYEGLVLKMESAREPDPETNFRPLVSVFKRTLPPGPAPDAVAYIRAYLISPPKRVLDPPKPVTGRPMAVVTYEMPVAKGVLKVRQLVRIVNSEAIIVTAFVPSGNYDDLSTVIDRIFASIDWSS